MVIVVCKIFVYKILGVLCSYNLTFSVFITPEPPLCVSDKKYLCIAVLNTHLAVVSVKLHPRPCSPASSVGGPDSDSALNLSPSTSPRTSLDNTQCSLIPLSPMSSARCGGGVARSGHDLVAIGEAHTLNQ